MNFQKVIFKDKMKTILVPTDFSAQSENALKYAAEMNKFIKGEIILYHSYMIPVPATDLPIPVFSEEEMKLEAMASLRTIKEKLMDDYPGMPFFTRTTHGFAESEIIKQERENKCDLVVMGTRGFNGFLCIIYAYFIYRNRFARQKRFINFKIQTFNNLCICRYPVTFLQNNDVIRYNFFSCNPFFITFSYHQCPWT